MAIEFNCPYCTATIRVPDQFSGKRGSCPKCATRLLVPDVAPPAKTNAPAAPIPQQSEPGAEPPSTQNVAGAAVPPPPPVPDAVSPPVVPGVPPFVSAASSSSLSRNLRRKERRKKSRRLYSIGIPVICFAAFLMLLAGLFLLRTPELKGTLRGAVSQGMQIPAATFPLSGLALSEEERQQAASAFAKESESFISPRMTCRINATDTNLVVDVSAGDGFVWLAVNPNADVNLMSWIRDNTAALNQTRLAKIATVGAELCRDKIRKASGSSVVFDAEQYRDGFGLNVHLNAFGFAIEGIVDRQLTPCAHEDANGTLYFAVPVDAKSMTLRGRSVFGGKPLFPGEYIVPVTTSAAAAETAATNEPPGENSPDEAMDADNMDADNMNSDDPDSDMSAPSMSQPGTSADGMQPKMSQQ